MFGFNAESLVGKGGWSKLYNVLKKDDAGKNLEIAKACASSNDDNAYNILVTLLSSDNKEVKLAAIKSIGQQGRSAAVTHLMHMATSAGDDTELKTAINDALDELHKVVKEP